MKSGLQMIEIPSGLVTLSDRRTQSKWSVEVGSFLLGQTPITQAQYAAVMGKNPSAAIGDNRPVEQVSWWDAMAFCNALSEQEGLALVYGFEPATEQVKWNPHAGGYRLPTEAEWERACRAGSEGPRYGLFVRHCLVCRELRRAKSRRWAKATERLWAI